MASSSIPGAARQTRREELKERAAQCRRLADGITDSAAAQSLRRMADDCDESANRLHKD